MSLDIQAARARCVELNSGDIRRRLWAVQGVTQAYCTEMPEALDEIERLSALYKSACSAFRALADEEFSYLAVAPEMFQADIDTIIARQKSLERQLRSALAGAANE